MRVRQIVTVLLALGGLAIAQDGPPLIDATDQAAIKANDGKTIILRGKVVSAEWSNSGAVLVIEFENTSGVMAAAFEKSRKKLDDAFNGDYAKSLAGATVRITGKLQPYGGKADKYKDALEVIVWDITQTTILELPATDPTP